MTHPTDRAERLADFDVQQFVKDRNEALLSLNLEKINAYLIKYGSEPLPDNDGGWGGIHKAITAITTFTDEQKRASKEWLAAHKMRHLDDKP